MLGPCWHGQGHTPRPVLLGPYYSSTMGGCTSPVNEGPCWQDQGHTSAAMLGRCWHGQGHTSLLIMASLGPGNTSPVLARAGLIHSAHSHNTRHAGTLSARAGLEHTSPILLAELSGRTAWPPLLQFLSAEHLLNGFTAGKPLALLQLLTC